ncbi:hypothetical protein BH11MYX3_BH11MYX3_44780 [soil metagenome]
MWQRTIDCLGLVVRVRTDSQEISGLLEGVLRSYTDASGPIAIDYILDATAVPCVMRDGEVLSTWEVPIELVPAFEIDLYNRLITLTPGVPLHAGAIVDPHGRALIFAGQSGAGKSTLIRALLQRGFRYLSEECAVLLGEGRCRGLARALNIEDPTIEPPAGYVSDDYVFRGQTQVRFRMFHPPEQVIWRSDAKAMGVVSITHAPDAANEIVRLSSGEALVALWPAMFRHQPEDLGRIGRAFEGVATFRLHTSSPARALEHMLSIGRELGLEG